MAHRRSVYVKRNNRTTTDNARHRHPNRTARHVFPVTTHGLGDEVSLLAWVSSLLLCLVVISFRVFSKEHFP